MRASISGTFYADIGDSVQFSPGLGGSADSIEILTDDAAFEFYVFMTRKQSIELLRGLVDALPSDAEEALADPLFADQREQARIRALKTAMLRCDECGHTMTRAQWEEHCGKAARFDEECVGIDEDGICPECEIGTMEEVGDVSREAPSQAPPTEARALSANKDADCQALQKESQSA